MTGQKREARLRADVPATDVFADLKDVDARHKAGHDDYRRAFYACRSGARVSVNPE
jgi:hypothetical protein